LGNFYPSLVFLAVSFEPETLDFGLKPAVFGYLTNPIAHLPIALESCSRAQTDRPVY